MLRLFLDTAAFLAGLAGVLVMLVIVAAATGAL